jgi:hypothetical protein
MKVGFFGMLGLIFITLKLTGYIAWSWWWVLLPIYFPALIFIVVLVIVTVVAALAQYKQNKIFRGQ